MRGRTLFILSRRLGVCNIGGDSSTRARGDAMRGVNRYAGH